MIKIDSHLINNYTLIVNGNGGAEQLVIVSSSDEVYTNFIVVSAQRSKEVIARVIHAMEYNADAPAFIRKYLREWVRVGTPIPAIERSIDENHIEKIIVCWEKERVK